jgi:two-component system, cell cycle response regulator
MQHNQLQAERNVLPESRPLKVAIIGFAEADKESVSRFFKVSRFDKPQYIAISHTDKDPSDILMVNYDNPSALDERDSILQSMPETQVVAVSRGPLDNPPEHHIRGMLFAARVLTALDKISIAQPNIQRVLYQPKLTGNNPGLPTILPAEENHEPKKAEHEKILTLSNSIQHQERDIKIAPKIEEKVLEQIAATVVSVEIPIQAHPQQIADAIGYRALVVDDSIAIQKSLEINLATIAQINKIDFADSGESALEKAESMQYDLIFLDVMMPGIDGYETCTRLRKKPEYKKTPIIMVSGKTSPLDEVKGVMAGCTTYLTKPVQHEAFQKLSIRVLNWLEKQKKT